jgi:transcriptional regulator with XRE-family HTH domain
MDLGERIRRYREALGISQGRLAVLVGIPRPAVSQMELGHRRISADELIRLSDAFMVSLDILVDPRKEPEVILEKGGDMKPSEAKMRISVPQRKMAKFREVLIYILSQVGAKPNVGRTVIYKLLYFIDFDHYEKHEEQIIGARYQKNKYGPTPMEFTAIVDQMIVEGDIVKVQSKYFRHPQDKYLALRAADLSGFTANEKSTIDDVLNRLSDMNAAEIRDYSHGDVPWLTTEDNAVIRYESVFYRTAPYSVRTYSGDLQED